ncbi:MAG: hypothetical protein K9N35_03575 [Candidatus Marinimicrobia bacterium]|nr:hypothetical protein [Candidatus Neomarinimicrobiota bacterium]
MNPIKTLNMNTLRLLAIMILLMIVSCTEELSIADFSDDFENYQQELRIEGILDQKDFSKSIIRIDRTILVTDTTLFNGRDDNGDWVSFTDENGNGRWDDGEALNDDIGGEYQGPNNPPLGQGNGIPDPGEPHVDDFIEILPQIHDSTMSSVLLREVETQAFVAEFEWRAQAASFDKSFGPGGPPELAAQNPYITYYYGAYVPAPEYSDVILSEHKTYQLEITTITGRVITATTDIILAPLNLNWEGTTWNSDTLYVASKNLVTPLKWNNPPESFFGGLKLDLVFRSDSIKGFYAYTKAAFEVNKETDLPEFQEYFIGFPLGLYRITLESYNDGYGKYVYSGLPLRDRELSNWRDQNGNVILGRLGSKSSYQFYMRLISPSG